MKDSTCRFEDDNGDFYYDFFKDLNIECFVVLDTDNRREMDKIKFLFKEKLHPTKIIRKILHRIRSNTFEGG